MKFPPPGAIPSFLSAVGLTRLLLSSFPNISHGLSFVTKGALVQSPSRTSKASISQVRWMVSSSSSSYLENLGIGPSSSQEVGSNPTYTSTASTGPDSNTFQHVPVLSLHHADRIAEKVIGCCYRNAFPPVCVYVLDASGHTVVFRRMDGCSPVGIPDFAHAKAFACIVNKYPSRTFRDRYTTGDVSAKFGQMLGMVEITGGKIAPFPGGILLRLGEDIVGAVGVSGAAGDEDEYCAIRGVIEADLGLVTVPEQHSCSTVKDVL